MAKSVNILVKIDTTDGVQSIGNLNQEITSTISTLGEMEAASSAIATKLREVEVGTAEYELLRKELIKVNTEIKNQELAMEALDNEQVASEIKSIAGGLTDMAGGLALVGVSGQNMEEVVQTMAKVEGISRLVTGGIEGYQSAMKLTGTISKSLSAAQLALGNATLLAGTKGKIAAVGMRVLNAVMKANPVFLIIGGITALIGAFALFSSSQESAAESAERLNKELEAQLYTMEKITRARKLNNSNRSRENQNSVEERELVLKRQIEIQKIMDDGSAESAALLSDLERDLYDLRFNNITTLRNAKLEDERILRSNANNELLITKEKIKAQEAVIKEARENGDQQEINDAIDKKNELVKINDNLVFEIQQSNKESKFIIREAELEEIKQSNELAIKQAADREKARQDRIRKNKEAKQAILSDIQDRIKRTESGEKSLLDARTNHIKDLEAQEIKLAEIKYGAERDKLVDSAIDSELSKLDDKFIKNKMSEEEYMAERKVIYDNGIDDLNESEKSLLEQMKIYLKETIDEIKARYKFENDMSKEQTEKVLANVKLTTLRHNKEMDMLRADRIVDEEERQAEYLRIIQKYKLEEISLIQSSSNEQQDILKLQYEEDIKGLDENSEKKKLIDAQYQANKIKLAEDTAQEIAKIDATTTATTEQNNLEKLESWKARNQEVIEFTRESLTTTLQIIGDVMVEQAARIAYAQEEQYNRESEALQASLANKEISSQQYEEKLALLNQKREQQELAAKRKAFQQDKAINIAKAIMATALSVIKASPNPAMMIIAGALGAAQTGVIAAQKFRAARGGVVPNNGQPSHIDSVDALLAPGETVINAESSRMFPQLLSQINTAGGGVALAPSLSTSSSEVSRVGGGMQQQIVKAYVVESEMTDAQKKVKRIKNSSTF